MLSSVAANVFMYVMFNVVLGEKIFMLDFSL